MTNEEMFKLLIQEIQGINNRLDKMDNRFDKADNDIQEMKQDFHDIKMQLNRIEEIQQHDVAGMLKVVDKKITNISYDIDYLREQSSKHDMDIQRMKKQIQS